MENFEWRVGKMNNREARAILSDRNPYKKFFL